MKNEYDNCALCNTRFTNHMSSWGGPGLLCGNCAKKEQVASVVFEQLDMLVCDATPYLKNRTEAASIIALVLRSPAFKESLKSQD